MESDFLGQKILADFITTRESRKAGMKAEG